MRYRVILLPEAEDDLNNVRRWYGRGGPAAKAKVKHILKAVRELGSAYWHWPQDDIDPRFRMRIVERHRIRFRVDEDEKIILVVRVLGPWQNLPG